MTVQTTGLVSQFRFIVALFFSSVGDTRAKLCVGQFFCVSVVCRALDKGETLITAPALEARLSPAQRVRCNSRFALAGLMGAARNHECRDLPATQSVAWETAAAKSAGSVPLGLLGRAAGRRSRLP